MGMMVVNCSTRLLTSGTQAGINGLAQEGVQLLGSF
jgi:hypothetical protein